MPAKIRSDKDTILEVCDIVKTFPGIRALDKVSFNLKRGEIHALVGENGAGKSTLIHILGGVHEADLGQIHLDGQEVRFSSPNMAAAYGIGVVYQELSVVENLSVAENIFANRQPVYRDLINKKQLYKDTAQILKLFELDIDPKDYLRHFSPDEHQVVEILKAISQNPKVVIFDEPTSSLSAQHAGLLFKVIRKLKNQGIPVIYISHHLHEVFEIADRVTVLRDGRNVGTYQVNEVTEEDLVRKMVGREISDMYGSRIGGFGTECFRSENIGRDYDFQDISLSIKSGEIVGLAGLSGAGRTELARGIFGAEPIERGQMFLSGLPIKILCPSQAIKSRIGYLTDDRKQQGLFMRMTVSENCVAPSLGCFVNRLGFLDDKAVTEFAEINRVKFNIITPSLRQQVENLSGGNQQKILLSMWIGIQPLFLIVDEPTRGVDVGAKSDIYHLLRELASRGVGILMISSDLLEILGLSDRILVMRNGRLVGEFSKEEATEESIIASASGVSLAQTGNSEQ